VFAAIYTWKKKKAAHGPVFINSTGVGRFRMGYPLIEWRRAGELYLPELAQKGMNVARAKMLAADVLTEEDKL
jgi:hypothetical protein